DIYKIERLRRLMTGFSIKAWNVLSWKVTNKLSKWSVHIRFSLLKALLVRRKPWPSGLPGLTVRQIYESAEATYVPPKLPGTRVLLVRASTGELGDTPYVDL